MFGGVETRKLAVLGFFGHGNFGDELILEGLRTLFNGWELKVFTSDFSSAYPFMDFDEVNKCDFFVLGGGELISPDHLFLPSRKLFRFNYRSDLYRLFSHSPWAFPSWVHKIKIPKVVLGCGVNGNHVKPKVMRELEQFSYIGLRDNTAVEIVKKHPTLAWKTHLFYDLAFALKMSPETCRFMAKLFPFKLHGLILAYMAGTSYTFPFYHPKVQRVYDTIQGLTVEEIREKQKASFDEYVLTFSEFGRKLL